jgi:hypothetical protein
MQKVKQFFVFIFGEDVKEILIRVILIQVIILLFTAMSGEFQIKVYNKGYIDIDSVDGKLGIDNGNDYRFKIDKL